MAQTKQVSDGLSPPAEAEWLEFEKALGISDSSSAGTPKSDKIYVLTKYARDDIPSFYGYALYLVDVSNSSSSSSNNTLLPILGWDYNSYHAFAICGYNLYLFADKESDTARFSKVSLEIYDLRRALPFFTTTTNLDDASVTLEKGPQMSARKCEAVAVVIGEDSKICVFGLVLHFNHNHYSPCFELFDTRESRWTSLPEPMKYDEFKSVIVQSYCVHRSCLIIQTVEHGIYGINVDSPTPRWVKLKDSERICDFPFMDLWTMVDNKLCSQFSVMKRGDLKAYPFAIKPDLLRPDGHELYLGGGVDDHDLCLLRLGIQSDSDSPNMYLDIVKFDKLGSDLSEWKEMKGDKSFSFALMCPCDRIHLIACFPIKAMEYGMCNSWKELKQKELKQIGLQVALESTAPINELFVTSHRAIAKGLLNKQEYGRCSATMASACLQEMMKHGFAERVTLVRKIMGSIVIWCSMAKQVLPKELLWWQEEKSWAV